MHLEGVDAKVLTPFFFMNRKAKLQVLKVEIFEILK
jgi:hypothetical protein